MWVWWESLGGQAKPFEDPGYEDTRRWVEDSKGTGLWEEEN